MWKKLSLCALLALLLLSTAFADSEFLQDWQNLEPFDFAQKYISAEQRGTQLLEKLLSELGEFDFWPQSYKKKVQDSMEQWERMESELQIQVSPFDYGNPIYYFHYADPNSTHHVSEEEAKEKALAWAVEKGLLSQADLLNTRVANSLVVGDYVLGNYPNPMWIVHLHGTSDEPIEVWLSAMSGKLPKHTSAEALAKGRQSLLAQMKEGLELARNSDSTGFIPATPEEVEAWYGYAVYMPSRGLWYVVFDNGNTNYYWVKLYDSDLRNEEWIEGGNG